MCVVRLVHRQVRREFHLLLQVAPRKKICWDSVGMPCDAIVHISTYIVNWTYGAYLHEHVKVQTLDAAHERWLKDSAHLLDRHIFPVFCAPLEDFNGRGVEFECSFYVVSKTILEKSPHHPAPSCRCQLLRVAAQFCILPHCKGKSGSDRFPAFSFQSLRSLLYDRSRATF